ncbi:hypothetical protein E5206_01605 [Arthrobacter sp. PAMC25564]|uniref:hypothetical protein n=1 Tax=Arthrobacter sp. PAMC25564 TaxID=2565366 RepID=UPI0010A21C29|nr:hypothetical protein [Arthrobacter sp. PAMC25564]QCB95782.1 hypothetical protein E5206_01605 [Arthrobacter sp. PAMC25564]
MSENDVPEAPEPEAERPEAPEPEPQPEAERPEARRPAPPRPEVPAPGKGHPKPHETFVPPGPEATRELREMARRRREAEEKLQHHLLEAKEKPAEH